MISYTQVVFSGFIICNLFSNNYINAGEYNPRNYSWGPESQPCSTPQCEQQVAPPVKKKPYCAETKSLPPCKESNNQWYTNAEVLYWTILQGETDYVVKGVPTTIPADQPEVQAIGDLERATYDWNTGFRASLGFHNCCTDFIFEADYLYFNACGSNSVNKPTDKLIEGTFFQFTVQPMLKATSNIEMDLQIGNLTLMKKINTKCSLDLHFLAGVTSAWLKQDWNIKYFPTPLNDAVNIQKINHQWSYFGVGLRSGFNALWHLTSCLDIQSKFAVGLLYGSYTNKGTNLVIRDPTSGNSNFLATDFKLDQNIIVPHYQIALGPQYDIRLCGFTASLYALYEMNIFQNLHYVLRSQPQAADGTNFPWHTNSLTGFHGVTFGINIGF